jgi:sugar O-acyltransferase (sialic acid O-acetyltransferase NeuD family)
MIIIGAKGFAKEVLEVAWQNNIRDDIAFFDNVSKDLDPMVFNRFRILVSYEDVTHWFLTSKSKDFVLGIGNPSTRRTLTNKFEKLGGTLSSLISPFAHIGHFGNHIGVGCTIMTGVVITNSITLGKGSLINLNCTIGHDSIIGEFVEMSPGTHISGNCKIGDYCIFGTNSTLLPKVSIGNNVIIGAGAVITKDVPDNSLVVGTPGKIIKELPPITF